MAAEFHAKSLMAAPLVVSNEVIGAAVFLHASEPDYFNDDLAAKATILAGQLGSSVGGEPLACRYRARSIGARKYWPRLLRRVHAVPDSSAVAQTRG